MDQGEYTRRFREVKVARENVRTSIENFPVALVENLDSQGIDSERRAIADCVKIFNDKVSNLKVDLDGDEHEEDARRLSNLDKINEEISDEVLTHKKLIGEKFESIKNAKDAAKKDAEKAVRDQEKAAEKAEKERLNELAKTEKKNKIEVRHSSILLSVNELKTSVSALKPIDSLSDVEVKQAFSRVTEWKKEISKIKESKTQFDVDVVGVGLEQTKIDDLKSNFEELVKSFLQIQIDVEKADKERSLYLSHKPVKELSVYPAPFGGKANENVYKFKQKMIEAMEANQIAEKDKIEVLRKHLKGFPKDSISDDVNVKNVTEAFEILIKAFGNPSATWESIQKDFLNKCSNPSGWQLKGSYVRRQLVFKTADFLKKALQYSIDFKELSNEILSKRTILSVYKVLPSEIVLKVNESLEGIKLEESKRVIEKLRDFMEKEIENSIRDCELFAAYQENPSINTSSFHAKPRCQAAGGGRDKQNQQQLQPRKSHDCEKKGCNTSWGNLGCIKLYELATVEERRKFLKEQKLCFHCGRNFHGVRRPSNPNDTKAKCNWSREMEPVRCQPQQGKCFSSAATCAFHGGEPNVSDELKAWLESLNIKTTLYTIYSLPCKSISGPNNTSISKEDRLKLQNGQMAIDFSDDELTTFFVNDLKVDKEKNLEVKPVPDGDVSFMFTKVTGKTQDVQVFFDTGCNCAILRDTIPQTQFRSTLLKQGPIEIDVATGIKVQATGEWGIMLPLEDGSHQAVRCLSINKVTSDMPIMKLRGLMDKIKEENKDHPDQVKFKDLQIPSILGGEIDALIGIKYANVHPELLFTLPNGLQIFKSKFKAAKRKEVLCIGGPLGAVDHIVANVGVRTTVRYLIHKISSYSKYKPRLDCFPIDNKIHDYVDKDIPEVEEILEREENECSHKVESLISQPSNEEKIDKHEGVECINCGDIFKVNSIQNELKNFLKHQEVGLDATYRCVRCRDCIDCKRGVGQELLSMKQQAEQELIRESVQIDKNINRAVAKLPFLCDPTDKLVDNRKAAERRLDNVVRKYKDEEDTKEKLVKSMNKLIDKGHIKFVENLPDEIKEDIVNSKSSYTIPSDVAFKEESVSTPARWVFDAGSKTSTGFSLNDILAKGTISLVLLINMVLSWRMGESGLCGDIQQFYNTILLDQDHWKYQKILIKPDLDPSAKTILAVICTLIYGVRPVGNMCEEVIKLLAESIVEKFPEVSKMLLKKRYVDDLGNSTKCKEMTEKLIKETSEVLASIQMFVKGWAQSGSDPPEELSDDGVSVGLAGMTWFPKMDVYKLNIQSLHFSRKKRGKYPSDLVKFEDSFGMTIDDYTPKKLTRTNCTSVLARMYDPQGLLAPLTLKMKNDLRRLIEIDPSWTIPMSENMRSIWIKNFQTVENVRDFLYIRCSIPPNATSCYSRILLLCDAADMGIVIAAYICYEMPGNKWTCDLLFAKGLLVHENLSIPLKELQALFILAIVCLLLKNAIGDWVRTWFVGSDSEICISWVCYERVKLTTFIRNRVTTIRSNIDLDMLHHVDGKHNPTDTGTRPDQVSIDSIKPGSTWLKGFKWMQGSIEQAKLDGIIKSVEDIKLNNENKKIVKEGIMFDTFDKSEDGSAFAVVNLRSKFDTNKLVEREISSQYLYSPLRRNFLSVVRITAMVILAARKFKKLLYLKRIRNKEMEKEKLKELDFEPPMFSIFSINCVAPHPVKTEVKLHRYFSADHSIDDKFLKKALMIDDVHYSAALVYIFRKASEELEKFNDKRFLEKIAIKQNGIYFCKNRLVESSELNLMGHLSKTMTLESFTGVNHKVPVIDHHSLLAITIANYLHYYKPEYRHRGAESLYRLSLQYCSILNGRKLFMQVSQDCIFCKLKLKKYLKQIMGPLSNMQLSISPIFYITLVDLWGPMKAGYHRETRITKQYDVYFMVLACCATGTVNVQLMEGKNTQSCLEAFNRFFCETAVPKIILTDAEGGLLKSLKEGSIDIVNLSGTLMEQKSIHFETAVPQGHYQHGKIEKKIHLLQESLDRAEFRNSAATATGWMTLGKLIERSVNSIPLGYLCHEAGGNNPLLRVLTPNNLKLITTSDRSPMGMFSIPEHPGDFVQSIQEKYDVLYDVWNNSYLPMMMKFPKWFDPSENLVPGDIIYFKLLESKMSATWRLGKVEKVKLGADGFVREVIVSYKDTSSENPDDWIHRAVRRPVRNVVKLFNIEETSFMEEIANAQKLAQEILEKKKISSYPSDDSDNEVINPTINKDINSEKIDIPVLSSDEEVAHIVPKPRKQRKKRSTELERLEIDMKGWNYLEENVNVEPFMNNVFMSYDVIPEDKDFSDIGSKLEINNDEDFIENVNNDFDNHMYLL